MPFEVGVLRPIPLPHLWLFKIANSKTKNVYILYLGAVLQTEFADPIPIYCMLCQVSDRTLMWFVKVAISDTTKT
jgi:hypothetical protein